MKRILAVLLGVAAASTFALAQAPAQGGGRGAAPPPPVLSPGVKESDLEVALLAAPAQLKDQATVIKFKPDFTYDTLRKGNNRLVCADRSGDPLQQAFMSECTSLGNLDRWAQNKKVEAAAGGDRAKANAQFDAMEKDGTRVKPEYGSVWYHFMGPDREHARAHMTIAVPGATMASTGLPENGRGGGVWIMNAGTTTAHLMTPGE